MGLGIPWHTLASIVAGHVPRAILMDTNLGDLASVAQDPKVGDARLTTAALVI